MRAAVLRSLIIVGVAAGMLVGCQQAYTMRLPDAPQARQALPDQDAYRHFRADAGGLVDVGFVPTVT